MVIGVMTSARPYLISNLDALFEGSRPILREAKVKETDGHVVAELLLLFGEI